MAKLVGTAVAAALVPMDSASTYPTHEAQYGKGGLRRVATIAALDSIPVARREYGMLVFVDAVESFYQVGPGPGYAFGAAPFVPGPGTDTIYPNTTAGLAGVAEGEYFYVADADGLHLYRDVAGVATAIGDFPTTAVLASQVSAAADSAAAADASQVAAAASQVAAAASQTAAAASATAATVSANAAAASETQAGIYKDQARAAAEASAPSVFYDTYAEAAAAIASIADDAVVQIWADETHSGYRTQYLKEPGNLVFKIQFEADTVRTDLASATSGKGAELVSRATAYFATKVAAQAINAATNPSIVIGGTDGGLFRRDSTDTTSAEDGGSYCGTIIRSADFATRGVWKRVYSGFLWAQWFGAVGDGVADDTTALQNGLTAAVGSVLMVAEGNHKQTSPLTILANTELRGFGRSSLIVAASDIEQLVSERTSGATVSSIVIRDLTVVDSRTLDVAGSVTRTKYQVRVTNGVACEMHNVETRCTLEDQTNPVLTNIGGIHYENFGSASAYLNKLINCWVRNGVARIDTSDSTIEGGFYWGFSCPQAIYIGNNNITLQGVNYIPSPTNGGVYIPSTSTTFLAMLGCFSDGSNVAGVTTGPAIRGALRHANIVGNRFWYSPTNAIHLDFADGASIVGNSIVDNNRDDAGHADILLKPTLGNVCRGVHITGNNFKNSVGSASKGNIFKEDDSIVAGGNTRNLFDGNHNSLNSTGYLSPAISSTGRSASNANRTIIGPSNTNMNTYTSGTATILSGTSSISVSHNLGITPFAHEIIVNSEDADFGAHSWRLGSRSSTAFGIVIDSAAAADITFSWAVKLSA